MADNITSDTNPEDDGSSSASDFLDALLAQAAVQKTTPLSDSKASSGVTGNQVESDKSGASSDKDKLGGDSLDTSGNFYRAPSRPPIDDIKIPLNFKRILDELGISAVLRFVNERREILAPYEMRQAVNPEMTSSMAEQYWTRSVPGIEGWRNVLVVLPLTVTWLSLGIAALAYDESQQTLAKLYKGSTPPDFFQLWQQGFPQVSSVRLWNWTIPLVHGGIRYLTFSDVALVDVGILILMLALTALSQFIVGRAIARSRKLEVWLNKTLHQMSVKSVVWSLAPSDQQPRWAAEVQTAINALNSALADVTGSVSAFKLEIVDQGRLVRDAVAQTGAVPVAVNDLIKVYGQAIEAQSLLKSALPTIDENLTKVADSQQVTAATWTRMSEELGLAVESIGRLMDLLGGTNDLREQSEQIRIRYVEALNARRSRSPIGRITGAFRRSWPFNRR